MPPPPPRPSPYEVRSPHPPAAAAYGMWGAAVHALSPSRVECLAAHPAGRGIRPHTPRQAPRQASGTGRIDPTPSWLPSEGPACRAPPGCSARASTPRGRACAPPAPDGGGRASPCSCSTARARLPLPCTASPAGGSSTGAARPSNAQPAARTPSGPIPPLHAVRRRPDPPVLPALLVGSV